MKSKTPLISVIVPTHNRPHLLVRALNSILAQTYSNLELIVIIDGSEDETQKVLKDYGKKVKVYINAERTGNAAARNQGIRVASGEYIAFLDDDDIWFPDKLEKQLRKIEHDRNDVCYCLTIWMESGQVIKSGTIKKSSPRFEFGGPTSTWLIHKSVFDRVGMFDESFPANVDGEFLFRLNSKIPASVVPECLYIHYYSHNQITASVTNKISGWQKFIDKHYFEMSQAEKSAAFFKLGVFKLLAQDEVLPIALSALSHGVSLKSLALVFISLLPKTLGKKGINLLLDFYSYPKSFASRYV